MSKGNKTGKGGFGDNPQNINKNGAPKRGESWAEIIDKWGKMTPAEAAKAATKIAKQLKQYGDEITLKDAVVIRGYAALLFEPAPGIMNIYMDRTDGKVPQKVEGGGEEGEFVHKVIFEDATDKGNADTTAKDAHGASGGE